MTLCKFLQCKTSCQGSCMEGYKSKGLDRNMYIRWNNECISLCWYLTEYSYILYQGHLTSKTLFHVGKDPKHVSKLAQLYFLVNKTNWWHTSAKSPHLNPIENLWHELKEYLWKEIKPKKTKAESIEGIEKVWSTVNVNKCNRVLLMLTNAIEYC